MNDYFGNTPSYVSDRMKFNVISLELIRVSGYQRQYLRPYQTTVNGQLDGIIQNMLDNSTREIATSHIARTCPHFIMPSSRPESTSINGRSRALDVVIPGGWDEKRLAFILKVEIEVNGLSTVELITGYTDNYGVAERGNGQAVIDPDMVFYINNVTRISERRVGRNVIPFINSSHNVFGGGIGTEMYGNRHSYKMSPSALVSGSIQNSISGLSDVPNTYVAGDSTIIGHVPTLSSRLNNSPTHMFANIVESYRKTLLTSLNGKALTQDGLLDTVRNELADKSYKTSSSLYAISNMAGAYTSTFDFRFLMDMDKFVDDKTTIHNAEMATTAHHAPWDTPTIEATMALVTANMVTNLMLNTSVASVAFAANNLSVRSLVGNVTDDEVIISDVRHISGNNNIISRDFGYMLESTIAQELCPILSADGEREYEVTVRALINTDIEVCISIGGSPDEIYVFPSFADSSISPIVTTNVETRRKNSRDVGYVLGLVEEHAYSHVDETNDYPLISDYLGDVNQQMGYSGFDSRNNDTGNKSRNFKF